MGPTGNQGAADRQLQVSPRCAEIRRHEPHEMFRVDSLPDSELRSTFMEAELRDKCEELMQRIVHLRGCL